MPSFDEILDAADKAQPGFRKAVLAAVEDAGAAINWKQVEAQISAGAYGQALDTVAAGWESVVPGATAEVQKLTVGAMDAGATVVEFSKVPGAAFTGGFTVLNPSSIHWAQTRSSTLITAISEQQQEAVRQIITRATAGELTTRSAASIIKGTVGLDPRRAQALATFSQQALAGKEGKALAAAEKAVAKYEQRLLRQRADTIARTEALAAVNEGQLQAWKDAQKKGNLGVGMVKRWIVTPDDRLCPLCKQMKVGGVSQQVQIDQPFLTPLGPIDRPPMHPNCRCAMGLVRGKPTMGKGVPQTGPVKPPTSTLSKPKPKTFPAAPSRAFPAPPKPALPPDPPHVAKLKSLGVDNGELPTLPGPQIGYNDRPWKLDVPPMEMLTAQGAAQEGTVQIADLTYMPVSGHPQVSKVVSIAEGKVPTATQIIRYKGKPYVSGTSVDEALAAWSKGETTLTGKVVDLDEYLFAKTPEGKIQKLITEAAEGGGEIPNQYLPFKIFDDVPFDPMDAVTQSGKMNLSKIDVPLSDIELPSGTTFLSKVEKPMEGSHAIAELADPSGAQTIIEYQGKLYAVNKHPSFLAEWAKGSQTVQARVFKYDEWLAQHATPAKIDALGVDQWKNIKDLPLPVVSKTGNLPASAIKKLTGKVSGSPSLIDVKIGDLTFGDGMFVDAAGAKAKLDLVDETASITVRKVGGKYVVTNSKDAEAVVAAWAKEVPTLKVNVQDWDQAYADLKAYNNANSAKSLAKKKAAKLTPQPVPGAGELDWAMNDMIGEWVPGAQKAAVTAKAKALPLTTQKQIANEVASMPSANPAKLLTKKLDDALAKGGITPAAVAPPPMPAPGIVPLAEDVENWFASAKAFAGGPGEVAKLDQYLATIPPKDINEAWVMAQQQTTVPKGTAFQKKLDHLLKKHAPAPPSAVTKYPITQEMADLIADFADVSDTTLLTKVKALDEATQKQIAHNITMLAPDDTTAALHTALDDALKAAGKAPAPAPVVTAPPPPQPPVIPKPPAASQAVRSPKIDDIAYKQIGPQAGSNAGGVYEAKDGTKWYVKFYSDADQGVGESLANAIYNDLSLGAPQSVAGTLADGRTAFASRYFDDVVTTIGKQSGGLTAAQADRILDGFAADVLTANWDAVGTGLDNVIVRANGVLTRVDQGGTFLFRAKAGKKPANLLNQITEWEGFADSAKNPYYSSVFTKAGISHADDLGKRIIQQIDAITALQTRYGSWSNYVAQVLPDASAAQRKALSDMLTARHRLLKEKRDLVQEALNSAKLPKPPQGPWMLRDDADRVSYGANAEMQEAARKVQQTQPTGYREARSYTGSSYRAWNAALRDAKGDLNQVGSYATKSRNLDKLLDSQKLSKPILVWRKTNLDAATLRELDQAVTRGGDVVFHGYSSTSINVGTWHGSTTFEIETDRGLYVDSFSMSAGEKEFIIPRGAVMRVVGKKQVTFNTGYGKERRWVYQLRMIGIKRP